MYVSERLRLYARLIRLDKPVGTLLLLWPTLTALWIASGGMPSGLHLAIFAAGTVLMRSAGCAVNDVFDRDFDGHVKRTADRVVASGKVSPGQAWAVGLALIGFSALLLIPLNALTFWLAIAFSFGIPMAFAAVRGEHRCARGSAQWRPRGVWRCGRRRCAGRSPMTRGGRWRITNGWRGA